MLPFFLILGALFSIAAVLLFGSLCRFRAIEYVPLIVMGGTAAFLSRFETMFMVRPSGIPFEGQHFLMLGWVILLGVIALSGQRNTLHLSKTLWMVSGFIFLALLSAALNGGSARSMVACFQVLAFILLPMAAGLLVVRVLPKDRRALENLTSSFLLVIGVAVPILMISTAVSRGIVGNLLGWQTELVSAESGLTQARSFFGGRITSGLLVCLAYGLALMRFTGRGQLLALVPLGFSGFSLLFTLSRTVILLMGVFHIIFFWQNIRRNLSRLAVIAVLAGLAALMALPRLTEHFSFERFLVWRDQSVSIRMSGIDAAVRATQAAPVLGHGPGQLYEEFRTIFIFNPLMLDKRTLIMGRPSPLEPHNTYLYLASEHGLPAMILYLLIMLWIWRQTQRVPQDVLSQADRTYRTGFNAIWLAWFLGMWVHSLTLVHPKAALVFWMFAGIGLLWREVALAEATQAWQAPATPARRPSAVPYGQAGLIPGAR